jgi:UDP-galactopyranose mutase
VRELAEAGQQVDMIDQRPHVGGNAFDAVDRNGIRMHRYEPRLLHALNKSGNLDQAIWRVRRV